MMMGTHQQAGKILAFVLLATSNGMSWLSGPNVGLVATGITVLGLALIGLRVHAIEKISKAEANAWADRVRLEMQIQADREKLEAGSLTGQIKQLQKTVEEDRARTEDANRKLHEIRGEFNTANLRHIEELGILTEQLKLAHGEVKALRENESKLLARLTVSQARQDVQIGAAQADISVNRAAIQELKAGPGQEAGDGGGTG
jgi:predicted  nucleic acid-binding Zn-ribbon protein